MMSSRSCVFLRVVTQVLNEGSTREVVPLVDGSLSNVVWSAMAGAGSYNKKTTYVAM
jgi:hypothetical protein